MDIEQAKVTIALRTSIDGGEIGRAGTVQRLCWVLLGAGRQRLDDLAEELRETTTLKANREGIVRAAVRTGNVRRVLAMVSDLEEARLRTAGVLLPTERMME